MRRTSSTELYFVNVSRYLAADEAMRKELLTDAEWNLSARVHTTNVSYLGGVLFAGIAASLLIAMCDKKPEFAVVPFGISLIAIVIGVLPALTELFRKLPTEQQTTLRQAMERIDAQQIQASRYAQIKQRIYHLQRNTFRFRWCSATAGAFLISGVLVVLLRG